MITSHESKPRIAIVTHGYDLGGGVPTVAKWLWNSLRETGSYEVDLVDLATSRGDAQSRRLLNPRSWLRPSLCRFGHERDRTWWGANAVELEIMRYRPRRELTRFLNSYDLIQVVCGSPAWAAPTVKTSRPVVVQAATLASWERGSTARQGRHLSRAARAAMTFMAGAAERTALNSSSAMMVENSQMAAYIKAHAKTRVHVAPPGVNVEKFAPRQHKLNGPGYLLSLCRLSDPRKGLDRMIRAYEIMLSKKKELPPLVLAGSGCLSEAVSAILDKSPAKHKIAVRSNIPESEIVQLYQGASVYLQTSHEEGLGMSVLEAMATGIPVVSSTTAGSSELVDDGVTGWLVDPGPAFDEGFAQQVLSVLDNPEPYGKAARMRAEELFSTEATLKVYMTLYAELLNSK